MIKIQIKNFGPISEADIQIGRLTIFAGVNNSGKSFASRLIYSILNSLQSDLYVERASQLLSSLHQSVTVLRLEDHIRRRQNRDRNKKTIEITNSIRKTITRVSTMALTSDPREIIFPNVVMQLEDSRLDVSKHLDELRSQSNAPDIGMFVKLLERYLELLRKVIEQISRTNARHNFVESQLKLNLKSQLTGNFQIPSMEALCGSRNFAPVINFLEGDNSVSFTLERSKAIPRIKLTHTNIEKFYPSNLFIESPIYWKLGVGMFRSRYPGVSSEIDHQISRIALSGVPEYVSALRAQLLSELTGEIAFPEIIEWLRNENIFNGSIVMSPTGQLLYQDNHRQYPLQTTATGITSIGIIGLLVERKLIRERTYLFIDEPESNLHPAWQVVMAKLLVKLAQAGVNVVFATHSIDILKYVEVLAENDSEIVDLIQLNHFPNPSDSTIDFFDRLRTIMDELSDPYYRLYIGRI